MLRVFKAKTREYIKEAIELNNLQFPWKFGGFLHEPNDGQLNGFTDWRRIINEEKLQELTTEYFQKINDLQPLRLERIVEQSLMSQIYRELMRTINIHQNTILNASIFKFTMLKIFFGLEFIWEDKEINHQKSGISTKISMDMIFSVCGEKGHLQQIKQLFPFLLMSHLKHKDQPQFQMKKRRLFIKTKKIMKKFITCALRAKL